MARKIAWMALMSSTVVSIGSVSGTRGGKRVPGMDMLVPISS